MSLIWPSRCIQPHLEGLFNLKTMKRFIPVVLLTILIQACNTPDPDTTLPTIEVLTLTPSAGQETICGEIEDNVILLTSTDTLEITFRLIDDVELSQYKIDLHSNFDCHGHSGKTETTVWSILSIEDVVGSDQTITLQLAVPTDVTTGLYHLSMQATDAAGNEAQTIIYDLSVTNETDTEAPVLSTTVPASSSFSALKGSTVSFEGSLTDNNPLGPGTNGRLELRYWRTSSQNIFTLFEEDFENSTGESYSLNFDVTVPATLADGTYIFELRGFDAVNNPSNTVQYTVEID